MPFFFLLNRLIHYQAEVHSSVLQYASARSAQPTALRKTCAKLLRTQRFGVGLLTAASSVREGGGGGLDDARS